MIKLNCKGFMMAEVIIVSTVILGTLVGLYTIFNKICNIFFKLEEKNLSYDKNKSFDINNISNESSLKLAKIILRFKDEIYESSKSLEVYALLNYTYEVAAALHKFYYDNIVLEENESIRQERLTLVKAVKKILGICFDIIGISKVERMW